jgi:hypothetical protein
MKTGINMLKKIAVSSTSALGTIALLSFAGTALAESQSRPAVTIAPFVLKSTVLDEVGTNAYRPWFENRKWTGDLIEYFIFPTGQRCTSVAVGQFPPDDTGSSASCVFGETPVVNWSARGAYPDLIADPVTGTTTDDPLMDTYWQDRNLLIYSPDTGTTDSEEFRWGNLSAVQRQILDPETCQGIAVDLGGNPIDACASGLNANEDSIVLNYIRGDRSLETDRGGVLRRRFSLLGAIINSRPVYVPVGNGLVVVGSNGGIVHGFSAADGSESFGYVPSQFLPHLGALTSPQYDYNFRFFADGELRYAKTSSGDPEVIQHVVAAGLGSGGKGLFALDVSSPSDPTIIFELSGTDGDHIPNGSYKSSLGFIHGRPTIAKLPNAEGDDGEWYVVTGNGFESGAGARLVLVRLSDGFVEEIRTAALGVNNGLSAPALVDVSGDDLPDFAYAGDLEGNLWRFSLKAGSRSAAKLFTASSIAGGQQSITVEPDIGRHPSQTGVMVYFGTGRLLSHVDADDATRETVYGIWDQDFQSSGLLRSDLHPQTLTEKVGDWTGEPRLVRIIEDEDPSRPNWDEDSGWMVDLPRAGERLLGRPQIRADRLQFITNNPTYDLESAEYQSANWINQLSLASGGSLQPPKALYDLDRSGKLDGGDAYIDTSGADPISYYPLGLNLGPGIISQPAFARVTTDIDAVFINGVIMLPPPESDPNLIQGGGDLDVTTDSAARRLANPHDASHPNQRADYPDFSSSPWANIPETVEARGPMNRHLVADGPGGQLDGHHRAYNRVHGVSYVDYFEIEPRAQAGQLRLDPGTVDEIGEPFVALRELNQPSKDVHSAPLIDGDQEFIVVLTNADLSQGTEIKIGCRTWATLDYQNMITSQLRADVAPADLVDTYHDNDGLVFRLNDIDPAIAEECSDGTKPTLRISLTGQVGDEHPSGQDVVIATLPGCVNNTHNLDGTAKTPGTNPHITDQTGTLGGLSVSGYRWRNGALTMQLLRVNGGAKDYILQEDGLPQGDPKKSSELGWGGIYAKGFELNDVFGNGGKVVGQEMVVLEGLDNGMLFESSLFWNYGDMKEFQQEGQDLVCYGDNQWASFRRTEWDGLNSSQYDSLVEELRGDDNALKQEYIDALALLQNEATVEEGLRELARIFGTPVGDWARGRDPEYESLLLGYYDRMRSYAKRDNLKLLDIDQDLFELPPPPQVTEDLTPATVEDVEVDLLPAAGPNFAPGRRSWIDITPE